MQSVLPALADIFNREGRLPHGSLNFITAHDGFTLRDLVSYNHKHNEANGEERPVTDGMKTIVTVIMELGCSTRFSDEWQSAVENNRVLSEKRLVGLFITGKMVYQCALPGMSWNTQYGNNNAYCQITEITWLKWDDINQTLFDFT